MSLRVIAGSAKGCRLKIVPGDTTRPVMDRVKEACFNILGRRIHDTTFLDLFAGTGSVGIEALSRGARQTIFVEQDRAAVKTIQANLNLTRLGDRAIIRRADVLHFLKQRPGQPFDHIYIAPPQYQDLWLKTLQVLDSKPAWLASTGTIIIQIDPAEQQEVALKHFIPYDERRYGNTLLWFFTPDDTAANQG